MKKFILFLFLAACGPSEIEPVPGVTASPSPVAVAVSVPYPVVYSIDSVDKGCTLISMGLDLDNTTTLDAGEIVHNVLVCPRAADAPKGKGKGHVRNKN